MDYLLPSVLMVFSYILGVYLAHQGLREKIDRPLFYTNDNVVFLLTILFGWLPALVSLYLAYVNLGWIFASTLFIIRFLVMTTLFNDKIFNFMNRKGI